MNESLTNQESTDIVSVSIPTEEQIKRMQETRVILENIARLLKCGISDIPEKLKKLQDEIAQKKHEVHDLKEKLNETKR